MKAIVKFKDLTEEKFFYEDYDIEDDQLIFKDDDDNIIFFVNLNEVRSVKFE